nr:gustatory receptor [Aedes albopictus]
MLQVAFRFGPPRANMSCIRVTAVVHTLHQLNEEEPLGSRSHLTKAKIFFKMSSELNHLCYLHRMTTEAVEQMTRILGLPLMITTLFQFFVVLTEAYYNYIYLMNSLLIQNAIYGQALSSTLFMLMCLLQFYYSIWFSAHMTKTAETTALLLNEFFFCDVGPCVEQSIETFTLEMLHRDYRVRLYDCFAVDFTLAYSAAATMTSYLILLVQFGLMNY